MPHGIPPVTLLSEGSESMTVGKQKRDFMQVAREVVHGFVPIHLRLVPQS